jgi:hypothetical protein
VVSVTDPYGRILDFLDRRRDIYLYKLILEYVKTIKCIIISLLKKYSCDISVACVGASDGNLTLVGNTGDQVTLTQIGIQVTAR